MPLTIFFVHTHTTSSQHTTHNTTRQAHRKRLLHRSPQTRTDMASASTSYCEDQAGPVTTASEFGHIPAPSTKIDQALTMPSMENLKISTLDTQQSTFTIQDLQRNTQLWYQIHVLIYDLKDSREALDSHERIHQLIDVLYIGVPYFTIAEADMIKSTLIDTSKLLHPGATKIS